MLRVVVVEHVEAAREQRHGRGEHTAVPLGAGEFCFRRIARFADGAHFVPIAQHAPIRARIGARINSEQCKRLASGALQQGAQRVCLQHGAVAIEDERHTACAQVRCRLLHGVSGAALRLLDDDAQRRRLRVRHAPCVAKRLHLRGGVASNDSDGARRQRHHGGQHMRQQRLASERLQHLGVAAFHACALTGGHDDDVKREHVGHGRVSLV